MYYRTAVVSVVLASVFLLVFASGQFGESAGALVFNVSLGGQQSLNYTVYNEGSTPIGFAIVFQGFNPIANTTMPTVIITPMNGTIAPHQSAKITAQVEMPSDQRDLKARWDGLIQAVEQQYNVSGQGGATIYAGLGKEIVITAQQAKGINIIYVAAAVGAVVAAGGGSAAYLKRRGARKKAARKRAGRRTTKRAARKPAGKGRKKATRKAGARPSARKRTTGARATRSKRKTTAARGTRRRARK